MIPYCWSNGVERFHNMWLRDLSWTVMQMADTDLGVYCADKLQLQLATSVSTK